MSILLIPISFVVTASTVHRFFLKHKCEQSLGRVVLCAGISWYLVLVIITEFNSLIKTLHSTGVTLSWCLFVAVCLGLYFLETKNMRLSQSPMIALKQDENHRSVVDNLILILLIVVIGATGAIALTAAPNNYDSMTTHLSRVIFWMQNSGVQPFQTPTVPQAAYPPAAEYGLLHIMLLSGTDRFVNLLQFFCWLGTAVGAGLIAQEFGLKQRHQYLSGILALTVPISILEATSTQNDLLVGYFLISFSYFMIRYIRLEERCDLVFCAASLGLAVLTKPYALIYGFPFACWLTGFLFYRRGLGCWRPLTVFMAVFASVNLGLWTRNIEAFGAWMPKGSSLYVMQSFTPGMLFGAWIKNIALQISVPFEPLNIWMNQVIYKIHNMIGTPVMDSRNALISPDLHCCVQKFSTNEDLSSNPVHFVLSATSSLIAALWIFKRKATYIQTFYFLSVVGGTTVLCFYLKWHPFFTRYHVFYYAAIAPVVAAVMSEWFSKKILQYLCVALLLTSIPWFFFNDLRPFFGKQSVFTTSRIDQYFAHRPDLKKSYLMAADWIYRNDLKKIGLLGRHDDWDYPLWALIKLHHGHSIEMRYVDVKGPTAHISQINFEPQAVVCFGLTGTFKNRDELRHAQEKYGPIHIFGSIYILTKMIDQDSKDSPG